MYSPVRCSERPLPDQQGLYVLYGTLSQQSEIRLGTATIFLHGSIYLPISFFSSNISNFTYATFLYEFLLFVLLLIFFEKWTIQVLKKMQI